MAAGSQGPYASPYVQKANPNNIYRNEKSILTQGFADTGATAAPAFREFFGDIGGLTANSKILLGSGVNKPNFSPSAPTGPGDFFNPGGGQGTPQTISLQEKIKAGTNIGYYGMGKYDYYVATDEVTQKQVGLDKFGKPVMASLQKFVPYALSAEGKGVVDESVAQGLAQKDLVQDVTLKNEQKRNAELETKKARAGSQTRTGKSPVAAQSTILTGSSQDSSGSLLGGLGKSKTLLGS